MYHLLVSAPLLVCLCTGQLMEPDKCGTGEYTHIDSSGHPVCLPCTLGKTYMPEKTHNNTQCYNCTQINDQNFEKVHIECNKENNTVIACIFGYFRNTENDICVLCQSCNHTGRQCSNFSNSVCCPGDSFKFTDGACKIFCSAGEYLSEEKCLPCKDGYFNAYPVHTNTSCTPCKEPDHYLHLEVIEACNKTHDTTLGCKRHYYISEPVSHLKPLECDICRNCSVSVVNHLYVGRNCTGTANTVCCAKPGMAVTDSGVCVENGANDTTTTTYATTTDPGSITCGKEHYLDIDSKDTNTSCLPCMKGTFQDKDNHTDTHCKNCTEYIGSQVPETCQEQDHGKSTLSIGYIILIVICIVVVVVVVVVIIIRCICKRRRQRQRYIPSDVPIGEREDL